MLLEKSKLRLLASSYTLSKLQIWVEKLACDYRGTSFNRGVVMGKD